MENLITLILKKWALPPEVQLKKAIRGLKGYTGRDLIKALISTESIEEAAILLGYTKNPLKQSIRDYLKDVPHTKTVPWNYTLLSSIEYNTCYVCKGIKPFDNFGTDLSKSNGKQSRCKKCAVAVSKEQKTYIVQRTPKWADLERIREYYNKCPEGCHVDHIIPLRGKLVTGLHTIENLQYMSAKDNMLKSNNYTIV